MGQPWMLEQQAAEKVATALRESRSPRPELVEAVRSGLQHRLRVLRPAAALLNRATSTATGLWKRQHRDLLVAIVHTDDANDVLAARNAAVDLVRDALFLLEEPVALGIPEEDIEEHLGRTRDGLSECLLGTTSTL